MREIFNTRNAEKIHQERKKLNRVDKNLCTQSPEIIKFENLNKKIEARRFAIDYKNTLFECFFTQYDLSNNPPESKDDKLYIQLSAGIRDKKNPIKFERWSYFPYFDGHVLNIDDPMYKYYPGIKVGWYYGDKNNSYLMYIYEIVKKLQEIYNISNKNLYFIGSSSAGYASLYLANKFQGSNAIAYSPQIVLKKWGASSSLEEMISIDLSKKDKFDRHDISYIAKNNSSRFLIYVNAASRRDWDDQIKPLCEKLSHYPIYGFSRCRNFAFLISNIKNSNTHGTQLPKYWFGLTKELVDNDYIKEEENSYIVTMLEDLNEIYTIKDKVSILQKILVLANFVQEKSAFKVKYEASKWNQLKIYKKTKEIIVALIVENEKLIYRTLVNNNEGKQIEVIDFSSEEQIYTNYLKA